jgi:hypothetical protein
MKLKTVLEELQLLDPECEVDRFDLSKVLNRNPIYECDSKEGEHSVCLTLNMCVILKEKIRLNQLENGCNSL